MLLYIAMQSFVMLMDITMIAERGRWRQGEVHLPGLRTERIGSQTRSYPRGTSPQIIKRCRDCLMLVEKSRNRHRSACGSGFMVDAIVYRSAVAYYANGYHNESGVQQM